MPAKLPSMQRVIFSCFLIKLLLSADFFPNELFQKIPSGTLSADGKKTSLARIELRFSCGSRGGLPAPVLKYPMKMK